MKATSAGAIAAVVALGISVVGACSNADRPACHPGEYVACPCSTGEGWAKCVSASFGYGTCDCSAGTPGLDGCAPPPSFAGVCTANCPFGAPCEKSASCVTGTCATFSNGSRCTLPCAVDGDCPCYSGKCGGQKVCKVQ